MIDLIKASEVYDDSVQSQIDSLNFTIFTFILWLLAQVVA